MPQLPTGFADVTSPLTSLLFLVPPPSLWQWVLVSSRTSYISMFNTPPGPQAFPIPPSLLTPTGHPRPPLLILPSRPPLWTRTVPPSRARLWRRLISNCGIRSGSRITVARGNLVSTFSNFAASSPPRPARNVWRTGLVLPHWWI